MTFRHSLKLPLALAVLGFFGWFLADHIQVRTDLGVFMPHAGGRASQLLFAKLNEGPASGVILLALSGGTPDRLAKASDRLADAIEGSGEFWFVTNGRFWAPPQMMRSLFEHRYIIDPEVSRADFSAAALRHNLQEALGRLGTTTGLAAAKNLPADPTNRMMKIAEHWQGGAPSARTKGVWFTGDRQRALLMAQTKASGLDFLAQQEAQGIITTAFAEIRGGGELRLEMSGPAVFALEASRQIRSEVQILTAVGSGLVFCILLVTFRSLPLMLALFVPVTTGILVASTAVQLTFGYIHAISLTFGIALLGVAIDYPVHLVVHASNESPLTAVRGIWPTLRLGALTTVVGFIPIALSSFPGMSQMGLFAIIGLLTAAATTRWVLPAIFPPVRNAITGSFSIRWLSDIDRLRSWQPAALFVFAAIAAYSTFGAEAIFDDDLSRLSPVPQAARELDRELRTAAGAPDVRYLIVIEGETPEDVLQGSEDLQAPLNAMIEGGILSGFDMAAQYLPSVRSQEKRKQALPPPEVLQSALEQAQAGLPFRDQAFAPFLRDVDAARTAPPISYEAFQATSLGWLVEPLLSKVGDKWIGLVALVGVKDPSRLESIISTKHDPQVRFFDLKRESDMLVRNYRQEALILFGWGGMLLLMVLGAGLRSVKALLQVCTPIVVSVATTAGLFLLVSHGLSLFHLLSLLLVIGVGLDYALFVNRYSAIRHHRTKAFQAISICSATTVCAFAVLAVSETPVLQSIGLTVSTGTALSLLLTPMFMARRRAVRRWPNRWF